MDDREAKSAGPIEPASDHSVPGAASNLLDVAAQLAGLAEDLKALAARPIEPTPISAEPDPF